MIRHAPLGVEQRQMPHGPRPHDLERLGADRPGRPRSAGARFTTSSTLASSEAPRSMARRMSPSVTTPASRRSASTTRTICLPPGSWFRGQRAGSRPGPAMQPARSRPSGASPPSAKRQDQARVERNRPQDFHDARRGALVAVGIAAARARALNARSGCAASDAAEDLHRARARRRSRWPRAGARAGAPDVHHGSPKGRRLDGDLLDELPDHHVGVPEQARDRRRSPRLRESRQRARVARRRTPRGAP